MQRGAEEVVDVDVFHGSEHRAIVAKRRPMHDERGAHRLERGIITVIAPERAGGAGFVKGGALYHAPAFLGEDPERSHAWIGGEVKMRRQVFGAVDFGVGHFGERSFERGDIAFERAQFGDGTLDVDLQGFYVHVVVEDQRLSALHGRHAVVGDDDEIRADAFPFESFAQCADAFVEEFHGRNQLRAIRDLYKNDIDPLAKLSAAADAELKKLKP